MRARRSAVLSFCSILSSGTLGLGALMAACGSDTPTRSPFVDGTPEPTPTGQLPTNERAPCRGTACAIPECPPGRTTVIEGDVYDPAGKNRLYNVLAYVPEAELPPLAQGASCDQCGKIDGKALTAGLSDATGHFRLENTPAGEDVPVVLQVGKFRRKIVLPKVEACTTNVIKDGEARLPKNRLEGDLPKVAAVTGAFDELYCLLLRIGIDADEHTTPDKPGAVHIYRGEGGPDHLFGGAPPATTLWSSVDKLAEYDIVLLGCEGADHDGPGGNKTPEAKQAMREFTGRGGRIFATHYQSAWVRNNPEDDFKGVASWRGGAGAAAAYGTNLSIAIDTSFPKGAALSTWLEATAGTSDAGAGAILADNVASSIESVSPDATRWLYREDDRPGVTFMSFNTPVGAPADQQCGRAVISDLHYGRELTTAKPPQCAGLITPAGLALEFLLFDLSACVQPDTETPSAPK